MDIETKLGFVLVREGVVSAAKQFRELRLDARQDSPIAFPVDYSVNANQPISFWENRLNADDTGIIFSAEYENQLIGMMGIRRGESPKTKHSATI